MISKKSIILFKNLYYSLLEEENPSKSTAAIICYFLQRLDVRNIINLNVENFFTIFDINSKELNALFETNFFYNYFPIPVEVNDLLSELEKKGYIKLDSTFNLITINTDKVKEIDNYLEKHKHLIELDKLSSNFFSGSYSEYNLVLLSLLDWNLKNGVKIEQLENKIKDPKRHINCLYKHLIKYFKYEKAFNVGDTVVMKKDYTLLLPINDCIALTIHEGTEGIVVKSCEKNIIVDFKVNDGLSLWIMLKEDKFNLIDFCDRK